jgi:hypothetical protein
MKIGLLSSLRVFLRSALKNAELLADWRINIRIRGSEYMDMKKFIFWGLAVLGIALLAMVNVNLGDKMRNFGYIFLLFFIVCACSQKKTDLADNVYLLDPGDIKMMDGKGSDFFSEINLIPLKENDDFLIGRADKLIKCDSFFYVLDIDKTKSIYKYDCEGNPLKHFCKIGGSGDEYIEIIDFDIDQSSKEILILCTPPKILYTDTDFNNLKKNNYLGNNYFDRIVSWENKIFLYNHWNRTVACINPETGKSEECLHTRIMRGYLIDPGAPAFFKTSNNLYFQSHGDDCIYKLQEDRFVPYITLDYKNKESSMNFYEQKSAPDIKSADVMEHPVPTIFNIREDNGKLIFTYVHHFVIRICTYDIAEKKYKDQIKKCIYEHRGGCFDNALYGIENPAVMDIFKTSAYHEFMQGVKYDFTGKLDFDEEFENPVIVEQILK